MGMRFQRKIRMKTKYKAARMMWTNMQNDNEEIKKESVPNQKPRTKTGGADSESIKGMIWGWRRQRGESHRDSLRVGIGLEVMGSKDKLDSTIHCKIYGQAAVTYIHTKNIVVTNN